MFYFQAFFRCPHCSKDSTRIVKISVRSKFDAREKIGDVYCHLCTEPEALEFLEIEELGLSHLEEFIQWAPSESKSLEAPLNLELTTVEILNTR